MAHTRVGTGGTEDGRKRAPKGHLRRHPDRISIELSSLAGLSLDKIAARFNVGRDAIARQSDDPFNVIGLVITRQFEDDNVAALRGDYREAALNRQIVRVYNLKPKRVRVDSTTASGYWMVTEAGLFQLGYSKDHRPYLPQLKVMLSALDPLGRQ